MPGDPFYRSSRWRRLRERRLFIDNNRCTVPGCGKPASVVDHVIARRDGGADLLHNLRSLCSGHDRQIKEDASGKRGNGGVFKQTAANGMPTHEAHPFHAGGRSIVRAQTPKDHYRARARSKLRSAG